MKALRYYGPGKVEIEEAPIPEIESGEVLVQVQACGLCATDVKTYLRGHPKIEPGAVLGHEIAGVVAGVNGLDSWKAGDRVAVAPYAPCGECRSCRRGRFTLCDRLFEQAIDPGGFAEFVRVPARLVRQGLYRIPEGVSFAYASLLEPLACCIHGLEALQLEPDDVFLVIGDGPMGLLQAEIARSMGVKQIILSGMVTERLERARQIADIVVDIRRQSLDEVLGQVAPGGADKVIVSVGAPKVAEAAVSYVQKGGILNVYAGMPKDDPVSVDLNRIHYDEIRLVGTFGLAPAHFQKALDLLAQRRVNIEGIISGSIALEDFDQAIDDLKSYRAVKYVVEFKD